MNHSQVSAVTDTPSRVIATLTGIGNEFGKTRQTIARWIAHEGFPASQLPDHTWCTTMGLIEGWVSERQPGKT